MQSAVTEVLVSPEAKKVFSLHISQLYYIAYSTGVCIIVHTNGL